jgi:hypothetical protein
LLFETESLYVAQVGFKLKILLLLPAECWNYRYEPTCSASGLLQAQK